MFGKPPVGKRFQPKAVGGEPVRSGAAAPAPGPAPAKPQKPRKRSKLKRALPYVGLALGLAVLLYYPVSEAVDAWRRGQIAGDLDTAAATMDDSARQELLAQATAYNRNLAGLTADIPTDQIWPYERQLSEDGHNTAFAYVVAPTIGLTMPIYHGTSDAALSAGAGHLQTSSLPIGGDTTHSVITAHSGMEGMRAFDDIRLLKVGEVFAVKVLDEYYCYRVTGTETVLPQQAESLAIEAGRDLCTLVTCTPYGVNTHRLLVHAERCEMPKGFLSQRPSLARVVSNRRVWPVLAGLGAAAVLVAGAGVRAARKNKRARAAGKGGGAHMR